MQDLAVQDKLMLILQVAHRQPQLRLHACLALADPPRMRLVDREHLLLVRNDLLLDQLALHLFNLTHGMVQVPLNLVS